MSNRTGYRMAAFVSFMGIVFIGVGTGAIPVFAESTGAQTNDTTDVSKNPVTGSTTVTHTQEGSTKHMDGKRKYKKKTKTTYDKNGVETGSKTTVDHSAEKKNP